MLRHDVARAPALEALPRAASAAEIENDGRIDFSAGGAKSGLLLEVSAPGDYVLRAERARDPGDELRAMGFECHALEAVHHFYFARRD